MSRQLTDFNDTAKSLARNPLGIIALFIVLVYGLAALVTLTGGSFTPFERVPLVYFLVFFPVLVLVIFAWLVSGHSAKLFAPGDFKNEENYVLTQLAAVASLTAAATKNSKPVSEFDLRSIVQVVHEIGPAAVSTGERRGTRILWVDDHPENNVYEREAFEAIGMSIYSALTTSEALQALNSNRFAAVISDMGRAEGPREGFVLLDRLRETGDKIPYFIYSATRTPELVRDTMALGGQGCTTNAQELFEMVSKSVIERLAR
jgi:CheY-like chemotaxis protein